MIRMALLQTLRDSGEDHCSCAIMSFKIQLRDSPESNFELRPQAPFTPGILNACADINQPRSFLGL